MWKVVSEERWREAQEAEARYWEQASTDASEFARITYEKVVFMDWAWQKVPQLEQARGPFVEIGIGPLGVGCIHLQPDVHNGCLV